MFINVILLIIYIWILYLVYNKIYLKESLDTLNENKIEKLTDKWINNVISNKPVDVANMFCNDGSLVGTVSREKRKGNDIKLYFDYFANLPNIKVLSKKYNISKIKDDVYINTAFIDWMWDGLENPVTARMSFTFRDNCIFQLHSSALPENNETLQKISGKT